MPSAEREVVVDRPIEEVYAFLANAENDAQWRGGVAEIRREGRGGVGAVYRQKVKGPLGRKIDADIETTNLVEHHLIEFRTLAGPVRPTGRYDLEPTNGGTRVRFRLDAEVTGTKKLILGRMVQKSMEREVGALDELKRVLERREG